MTIKVSGKCDANCGKDAKYWYGNTSAAYCGDTDCQSKMDASYQELSDELDEKHLLEQEMLDEWGDPNEY